jgi:N-acetylmuramoyl-L-alanine amidase
MRYNFSLNYSPNFSTPKRSLSKVKFIIIHYTGMKSENKAINRLTDVNSKVSSHFFVKKNGEVILMVPLKYTAWHAGKSKWKKFNLLNKYSVGIEIQNPGHTSKYLSFNKKQILSLLKLCKFLKKKLKINKKNILGHSDVSYARKKDPGEKFPWELFAKKNLSLWHNINKTKLASFRNKKVSKTEKNNFFSNLKKIGYFVDSNSKNKKLLTLAFQRKYRTKLLNGIIDKECLIIAKNLSKT